MKKNLFTSIITITYLLQSFSLSGQDGTLDNSFGINGKARFAVTGLVDQNNVFALQTDGKMITAGPYNSGTNWDLVVVRLNSDGSPDNSFGTSGKITTAVATGNEVPYGIVIQPDGKIIIGGGGNNADADVFLVRYNSNGTLDNSFDGDGIVITNMGGNEGAFGVALQPDGKIVAAGYSTVGGQLEPTAFRYNSNGTPDNSFDGDGIAVFAGMPTNDNMRGGLAIQPDGKIVMAGNDNYSGGNIHGELVRLNADGSPDNSFGVNGLVNFNALPFALFYGMTIQTDGKIIGVGSGATSTNPGSSGGLIARFNTNGTLDNTFNGNGYNLSQIGYASGVYGVLQQTNGKLIGAGSTRFQDPISGNVNYDFVCERFNINGSFDNAFDGDGVLVVQFGNNVDDGGGPIAIQPDGKYLFSGFVLNGASQDFAVMRVQSDVSVLPVGLLEFKAAKRNNSVELSWTTTSEQNNSGFEIQRSVDGINFTKTGWVNGAGNSSTLQHYYFTDAMPAKGKNFYRLNQIDFDGRNKLSDIRKVNFEATVDFTVYPNPVITTAQVQLNENAAVIRLLDISGKELWHKEKNRAGGTVTIPMQYFSSGIYLLQVTNNSGEAVTQKIIKQ